MKKIIFSALFAFLSISLFAQTPKIAYINMQELITAMPEYDEAMKALQEKTKSLEDEMEQMMVERNRKLEEYSTKSKDWTDLVRQSREQEIQQMNERIQIFQQSAQQSLEEEQMKLLQPITEKANAAIAEVAKTQGITYVINSQVLVYQSTDAINILSNVKKHLGIDK